MVSFCNFYSQLKLLLAATHPSKLILHSFIFVPELILLFRELILLVFFILR
jgi:hypothetical protein